MIHEPGDLPSNSACAGRGASVQFGAEALSAGPDAALRAGCKHPSGAAARGVRVQISGHSINGAAGAMQVYVCVTCRRADEPMEPPEARSGARLFAALSEARTPAGVDIVPVECLSVCKRPCTIGFAAAGKWTYVYGDFPPETSVATILAGAQLYAQAPDGIIPWRSRPLELKRGVVARIPPLPGRPSTPEREA